MLVWDETGAVNESDIAWFEMGLLKSTDWQAQWIGTNLRGGVRSMIPVPYLRKAFAVDRDITSARLYITALGVLNVQSMVNLLVTIFSRRVGQIIRNGFNISPTM